MSDYDSIKRIIDQSGDQIVEKVSDKIHAELKAHESREKNTLNNFFGKVFAAIKKTDDRLLLAVEDIEKLKQKVILRDIVYGIILLVFFILIVASFK